MQSLPETLRSTIPSDLMADAVKWWQALADDDRVSLDRLCDARKDIFLFETFSDADPSPRITGGKFLPHDDAFGIDEWGEDYFDYLLGHPELMIVFEPTRRTFHIGCNRHIDARRCFRNGFIPADFHCPFGATACLMDAIRQARPNIGLKLIAHTRNGDEQGVARERAVTSDLKSTSNAPAA